MTAIILQGNIVGMSKHLREARKGLGLTQAQVAEAIGKSQGDVCKYEQGTVPKDLGVITRLAAALHMSREEVLFGPAPEARPPKRRTAAEGAAAADGDSVSVKGAA